MTTLLATFEVPYYAIVDFALGAPRAALAVAATAIATLLLALAVL